MTSAHFTLTLDTKPPASPTLLINGGAAVSGLREVIVNLTTADYQAGARDVTEMKVWGDVDPATDLLIQPLETNSQWQTYQEEITVRLSAGSGRKYLYARLRDDVCNQTVVFSDFIDLNLDAPVVTITTPVDRSRISKIAPCDTAVFSWQASRAFNLYEVRVVPSIGSPPGAGVVVPTSGGSGNVQGAGAFPADTPIVTTVNGNDLAAASPGDGDKVIKVFVRDTTGVWSG